MNSCSAGEVESHVALSKSDVFVNVQWTVVL